MFATGLSILQAASLTLWESKKHKVYATQTEAEYHALAYTISEVIGYNDYFMIWQWIFHLHTPLLSITTFKVSFV